MAQTNLKDQLAKDVSTLDHLDAERKTFNDAMKESIKPIKDRVSKYAKAIKAGCITTDDYNQWAAGEWSK